MKKLFGILLAVVMMFSVVAVLVACDSGETVEIAVVTDVGQLNDGGFNQGTYEGAKAYAEAHGKTYQYYQPKNGNKATDADRIQAMNDAIKDGAKVIVTPGFLQEAAIRDVAGKNPEVKFIFIDGYPVTAEKGGKEVLKNVAGISFKEQESGFFAGYAAVKEGFTKLGGTFGGGGTTPACNRFANGYILGATEAAKEMKKSIEMRISFLHGNTFSASSELQAQINGWYENGTEVVFSCGGSMVNSVIAAADAKNGKVIGVDTDQMPLDMVDTCLCMGAGITMAQGFHWIDGEGTCFGFVGDSTFFASGMTGVVNAVYNNADMILCVLDNSTTAMTGHQPHPGIGRNMMGQFVDKVDIAKVLEGIGVHKIITVNPLDLAASVAAVQECDKLPGVKAIIFKSPCIAISKPDGKCRISEQCINCKKCIREIGCPALITVDGNVTIDENLCTGCGLCSQICPVHAIGDDTQKGGAIS